MEKRVRIIKKGEDDSNLRYWLSRTYQQRMAELERMRQVVNHRSYGDRPEFSRVYTVTKRGQG